ncbi:unnamed protein product [Brassica rapa]|uniref:Uncharacterized protein n=1 Tax=Brassica campestris TaxID=3711 RepID=A0A8D9HBB0_BRACM|nr:unnamed protein product [Brassica rapa]
MTSRHTQKHNVGDWSCFFNEEPFYAISRTLADADASEKVCEECKDTLHRRVAGAATIEKLFEDFQATLQTRVADVVQQVCEEFTATFNSRRPKTLAVELSPLLSCAASLSSLSLPRVALSLSSPADHDVPTVSQDRKDPPLVLTDCSDT